MAQEIKKPIFIVWAEDIAEKVANSLHDLLNLTWPDDVDVAFSPKIMPGKRWPVEVWAGLERSNIGIICITDENTYAPWLLYEAGALSKLSTSRVIPLMIGIRAEDLPAPLKMFQAVDCTRDGILSMIKSIADAFGEEVAMGEERLDRCNNYWETNRELLEKFVTESTQKFQELEDAASDGECGAVLQAIRKIIPSLSSRLDSARVSPAPPAAQAMEGEIQPDSVAADLPVVFDVDAHPELRMRALIRQKRLDEIRRGGGPSASDWRVNPAAEEYEIMKEAEEDDKQNPLRSGDEVIVLRHVDDVFNGSKGTVTGPWRVAQHYWVEFTSPNGSTTKKAFHVMYLTRAEWLRVFTV